MITPKEILEKRESIIKSNLEAAQAKEKAEKDAMLKFVNEELSAVANYQIEKISIQIEHEFAKNPMKIRVLHQYNGKYPVLVGEEIRRRLIDLGYRVGGEFDNGYTTQHDGDGIPHRERTGECRYLLQVEI